MTDPLPASAAGPGPALLSAAAVVMLGTAVVDASRLPLLAIPLSFLLAAYAAGLLMERLPHGTVAPSSASSDGSSIAGLATRLGLGIAGLSLITTACAVVLSRFKIAGIIVAGLAVYGMALLIRAGLRFRPRPSHEWLPSIAGGGAFGLLWLLAWLWGTIPPTFYDELVYHLVLPQQALATGATPVSPSVFFTLMPHASDLLLAWGLALSGDLGGRAMHVALWAACTLSAWGLAQGLAESKHATVSGILVVAALASSPMFWFLGTLPFAETALTGALVTAAGLLTASSDGKRPWLALGMLLGLAASVKLSGFAWAFAGLAAALVLGWRLPEVARAGLVAAASVAPWWGRALYHTGNPIYPVGYKLLGGRNWNETSQARQHSELPLSAADLGPQGLLSLPVDLIRHPERFGSASDAGLLAVSATCLMLVLPILFRVITRTWRARTLADAAAVFTLLSGIAWVAMTTGTRYFAPALVLGLVALTALTLHVGRAGRAAAAVAWLVLGCWGTVRFLAEHDQAFSSAKVVLGQEAAEAYLARRLEHYEAARFVRHQLPQTARLLFIGETRPYYFARQALAPYPYQDHPLGQWVRDSVSPEELARRVAAEGFTHVILNVREYTRLHDQYGMLAFPGVDGPALDHRLKELPGALRTLFAKNGVYVLAVPAGLAEAPTSGRQP